MPESQTDSPGRRSSPPVYWIASLALAVPLLYFSLRGIDWHQVWKIVSSSNVLWFSLGLCNLTLSLFLRALRWRVILQAESAVSIPLTFWSLSAGYLGNNVLPARAGEVIRSLMISRSTGLSKAFVLTTALSERVADAVAVITISSFVLFTIHERPGWLAGAARPMAVLGFCGVAAIVLIPAFESFWLKILGLLPVSEHLQSRIERVLQQGLQGIRTFHDAGRLARFVALTGIVWFGDGVTTIILAHSIHMDMSLSIAFLLIAGLALGSALPSTPGYVGIYQFVAVSVLTPFGFSRTDAIAYILLFQATNYFAVLVWGGIGFLEMRKQPAAPKAMAVANESGRN